MFSLAPWLAAFATGLSLTGCMTPTPFGSDVDQHELNTTASQRLKTPRSADSIRFVALGDSHDAYDELWEAVAVINRIADLDFVVHAGDISDYGLAQEYQWSARALSGLRVPAFVVIGNHDAISNGKAVYRDLYGPFDFSFRYGAYKFVCFNSNSLEFDGGAPDRAWLETQLADLQGAEWAVLVTHQNPEAPDELAGSEDSAFYERLLLTYPIALIVHGHLDDFELGEWHQVPNLQLGTFRKTHEFSIVSLSSGQVSEELCDANGCLSQSLERETSTDETPP
ncbi:MAG TPA: metallophosphoesterase [Polyangiaceae bacterium]|nr:metallophosphoesterase [Polyangiaceae bacterium]